MKLIDNLKIGNNKTTSLLLAGALAFTLVGCSNSNQNTDTSATSEPIEMSANSSDESIISKNIEQSDTAVEAAIGIMLDGSSKLAESSEESKNTESFQEAKEESMQNFITLSEFLRGEAEIAGYTIDEVGDNTKEFALESLDELDSDLERIYPNYKEEIKEKLKEAGAWLEEKGTDLAAKGYNKYQELKQKTLEKASK